MRPRRASSPRHVNAETQNSLGLSVTSHEITSLDEQAPRGARSLAENLIGYVHKMDQKHVTRVR